MSQVMPTERLDICRFQAVDPLFPIVKGFVRICGRRKQEPIADFPLFFQFVHRNARDGRIAGLPVFGDGQKCQPFIEINIAPTQLIQLAFAHAGRQCHQHFQVKFAPYLLCRANQARFFLIR